ncbi:radical SAM protein [Ruminiclostridium cellobioparum]|uniref:radical SAM protein n=1 Tax=Ruminiclostridium cellobioparum TaxID=29355 RepID=UPI0028AA3645|nr:radical SAM protein [Ruminiclostridium cellobioparum]
MEIKIYPKSTTAGPDYSEYTPLNTIYRPSGRAKQYAEFALNIYDGCNFSCSHCTAPQLLHFSKLAFYCSSHPKKNLLKRVDLDCRNLVNSGFRKKVLLCYACDPYQDVDLELKMTREVLLLFKKYGINFEVITRAGSRAKRDFDLYKKGDTFGTALMFLNPEKSKVGEPNAALPNDRIETLKAAYDLGISTWVSLEPIIDTEETLKLIDATHEFVDNYKIWPIYYDDRRQKVEWDAFLDRLVQKLDGYGKEYCFRQELTGSAENKIITK